MEIEKKLGLSICTLDEPVTFSSVVEKKNKTQWEIN